MTLSRRLALISNRRGCSAYARQNYILRWEAAKTRLRARAVLAALSTLALSIDAQSRGRELRVVEAATKPAPEALQHEAQTILAAQPAVLARYQRLYTARLDAMRIRVHGDYHLGQVLSTGMDFVILDFEERAGPFTQCAAAEAFAH
jgi:predicted trehalose synthase